MRYIVLFLFLVTTIITQSQENTNKIFKNLKNGAILVRLPNNSVVIGAIKQKISGLKHKVALLNANNQSDEYQKLVRSIENNQKLLNKLLLRRKQQQERIIDAFSESYNYCAFYFFYDNESKHVKEKQFEGVLLDANLNFINELPTLNENYLIADFSFTKGDTINYEGEKILLNENKEVIGKTDTNYVYYTGFKTEALVLFTPDFVPVQRPFPRFAKKYWLFIPRTEKQMVLTLQKKIELFVPTDFNFSN